MSMPSEPRDSLPQPIYSTPQPPPTYGPPAGYAPPQYYVQPRSTNGMAIAAMILGILWIYWIGSVLALIFGYAARTQIRQRNEGGDGMAIAGIVLGWIGVGALTIFLIALAAAAH